MKFIITVDSEEEAKEFYDNHRVLDVSGDEIEEDFNALSPESKDYISSLVAIFTNGNCFGYNANLVLDGFKDSYPAGLRKMDINNYMYLNAHKYLIGDDHVSFESLKRKLTHVKSNKSSRKGDLTYEYWKSICDCSLIEADLLNDGVGKVYEYDDAWNEEFLDFSSNSWIYKYNGNFPERKKGLTPDELTEYNKDKDAYESQLKAKKEKADWNTRDRLELFQDYLRQVGKIGSNEVIIKEKWGVIPYNGSFQTIKEQSKKDTQWKEKLNFVRDTIRYLSSLESKYKDIADQYGKLLITSSFPHVNDDLDVE